MPAGEKTITIVGGGVAGLSLGIALRSRGIPARLFEASRYPRHRVCGEFISGVRTDTLETLGIGDLLADAERLTSTTWIDRKGTVLEADLPTPALGISRYRFDQRMVDRFVELGGVLEQQHRHRTEDAPEEGVVLATGRPLRKESPWIGLKAHFLDLPLVRDLEMHLGEGGYLGLSRVEDGRVNVSGLFLRRPGLSASRETALVEYVRAAGLVELAERLDAARHDPSSCTGVSAFSFGYQVDGDCPHLQLGDRGAIIPPFTGNGMSMAMESAALAVDPLLAYHRGEADWSELKCRHGAALRHRFRRRLLVSRLFHPIMRTPAGRRVARGAARAGMLPFAWLYRSTR